MVMLKPNGANMIEWLNENGIKLEAQYGDIADFVRGDAYPVRAMLTHEQLTEKFPALSNANRATMAMKDAEAFMKKTEKDATAKHAIYSLLEGCVTVEGFDKVSRMGGFAATVAENGDRDPRALLALIVAQHTLKTNDVSDDEAKYIAEQRYGRLRMTPEQSLTEFNNAFKAVIKNMTTLQCEQIPTEAKQVHHFLMRLDVRRYGSYQTSVINALRKGEANAMPASIALVVDGARQHVPIGAAGPSGGMDNKSATPMVFAAQSDDPCGRCGGRNHRAEDCMTSAEKVKIFRQKKGPVTGPSSTAHVHATITENVQTDDGYSAEEMFGYCLGLHAMVADGTQRADILSPRHVCIDSLANRSFVSSEDLLTNVRSGKKFAVKGVHGMGNLDKVGDIPGFGSALYAPDADMNGLALCEIESRYQVVYDQRVSVTVLLCEGYELVFDYIGALGCYACLFDDNVIDKLKELDTRFDYYAMISTTSENEANYTSREIKGAHKAREMMRRMYYPADSTMIRTLTKGAMLECPVTGKDVVTATEVYGKDVASLKGKTKDKGPVGDYRVLVPRMMRKQQTVYGDEFHWRGVHFILFVSKPLDLILVQWLPRSNLEHMMLATKAVCNRLVARGFEVTEIVVDPAKELAQMEGKLPYNVCTVGSRAHVTDAEVQIRTAKERIRSSTHGLPFNVARSLVRWQVYGGVNTFNILLRNGQSVSSRELFTGVKPVYKRDVRAEFGEYVQAHVSPGEVLTRGGKERTVGAIALCSADNDRGTWWFMNLKTKGFFKADRWTSLPMPDVVVELLNQMYDEEELKANTKENKRKRVPVLADKDDVMVETEEMLRLPEERDNVPERVESATEDAGNYNLDLDEPAEDGVNEPPEEDGVSESPEEDGVSESLQEKGVCESPGENEKDTPEDYDGRNALLGARMRGGQRKSYRISARHQMRKEMHVYRLTMKKALKSNKEGSRASIMKELKQILDKEVWDAVDKSLLTKSQLKKAIRSSMFLTEKFTASGAFDKLKARLVAGGDMQDKSLYGNLSSPTVSQETVMFVLAVAAIEGRYIATVDITGAYLECELPEHDEVIMTLDPVLANILAELDPTVEAKKDQKGVLYVKLKKALYGCVQSAKLWYDKLCEVLTADGYSMNNYDPCLFNKLVDGKQITVAFHVDDLLVTSKNKPAIDKLMSMLKSNFAAITMNTENNHSYLSMNINVDDEGIHLDMQAYIEKCLEGKSVSTRCTSPAGDNLFVVNEDSPKLGEEQLSTFHSDVAKLLYLGKRTRGQILTAVSFLAGRVACATDEDQAKLDRVHSYLARTKTEVMHIARGGEVDPVVYIDASFGIHQDGTSRSGICIMLGGVSIGNWSTRQKLVTKSSTEAEVVALSDGLTAALWLREMAIDQGHDIGAMTVYQDNMGVISIMNSGRSPKHRTRHLNIRHFFARDRVLSGEIKIEYMPTSEMLADLLTKPVTGALFDRLSAKTTGQRVRNVEIQ
jgi:hypothetical protein